MSSVLRELNRFTYDDEPRGIKIRIKQLYSRHFEASAHVTIWAEATGGEWHTLFKARTPITTDAARKRIAKEVGELVMGNERDGDLGMKGIFGVASPVVTNDWKATINEAMEMILETHYAGTPPVNLYEDGGFEEDEIWRIPALLSEDINLVYGQSGSGKSYLALILGQAIHHGVPVCGLATVKGNVLYIDYETTKAKMRRRFHRVDSGLEVEGVPMLYMAATVPLVQMVEALQEYVVEHQIQFLVIDSLARASGGSITDEEGVGLMFEAVRQLELPCLIIHHTNRGDDYYGSTYIRANARNIWRLRSAPNEGQGKLSIQLQQEKENDGPAMGSLGFVLEFTGDPFDPDAVKLSPQDASLIPELRKHTRLWQQIQAYLDETQSGVLPIADIPDLLGLDKSRRETYRSYVWALKNNTKKYKKLAEVTHIVGDYLCLMGRYPENAVYDVDADSFVLNDGKEPVYDIDTLEPIVIDDWAERGERENNIRELAAEGINISDEKEVIL